MNNIYSHIELDDDPDEMFTNLLFCSFSVIIFIEARIYMGNMVLLWSWRAKLSSQKKRVFL
jgi:hypothetical protein